MPSQPLLLPPTLRVFTDEDACTRTQVVPLEMFPSLRGHSCRIGFVVVQLTAKGHVLKNVSSVCVRVARLRVGNTAGENSEFVRKEKTDRKLINFPLN